MKEPADCHEVMKLQDRDQNSKIIKARSARRFREAQTTAAGFLSFHSSQNLHTRRFKANAPALVWSET